MEVCDACHDIDGAPVHVQRRTDITLIGVAECNGTLALEHYRCDKCKAVISRQFTGESDERIWCVIEAAH